MQKHKKKLKNVKITSKSKKKKICTIHKRKGKKCIKKTLRV